MITNFIKGAKYALAGFGLMTQKGVRRYVAIPLIVNTLTFAAVIWYTYSRANEGIEQLITWLPSWLEWLSWLVWLLFAVLIMILVFYTFTLIANLIGAPFNGLLAEKLEKKLTGSSPPSSGRVLETLVAIKNALVSEVVKFAYLLSRVIPLFILSFVPGINVFAPLLWLSFGTWMLALEYMDYPMGNHGIIFAEQRRQLKQHRALLLGFGSIIMLMTIVPVLNFLAMPVAVAGATKLWVEELR